MYLAALAGDFGDLVNFGEAGLVTHDAVAANAHGIFLGTPLGITLGFFCLCRTEGYTRGQCDG